MRLAGCDGVGSLSVKRSDRRISSGYARTGSTPAECHAAPPVDASPLAPAPQPAAVTAGPTSNAASPVTVNGSVVPLQELDLNYSQPWAYTPAPSASPYVPTYNPSWPPAGGMTFLMGSPLIPCDPCNVPAMWVPARGLHHLRR